MGLKPPPGYIQGRLWPPADGASYNVFSSVILQSTNLVIPDTTPRPPENLSISLNLMAS